MRRSNAHAAAALAAFALFSAFAACSAAPAPPPARADPPPPPSGTIDPPAAEDAGARAADAPPVEEPAPLLPRHLVPGSTRGMIACGPERCEAGKQICVILEGNKWACVQSESGAGVGGVYRCDDGTDCPQGKTCCRSFASAAEYVHCTTRNEDCSIEVCEPGGARCPAGQSCQEGVCWPAKKSGPPTPTCDRGKVCPKEKPFCAWQNGRGTCVAGPEVPEGASVLRCTQNSDCGAGFRCCTGALGPRESFCTLNCDMANTRQYCGSDADCPKGFSLRCKKPDDADLPPWSKLCGNE